MLATLLVSVQYNWRLLLSLVATLLLLSASLPPSSPTTLYYSPHCPYCKEVMTYLKEKQITLSLCDVTSDAEGKKRLCSYGTPPRVPCLVVDDKPIYGSDPIRAWLTER